jgi:3-oxoacyl-[acyl-carrier protein] reductase
MDRGPPSPRRASARWAAGPNTVEPGRCKEGPEYRGEALEIRLDGKVALVTGASTGIGAAIAITFARAGAKLALHYNTSAAEATKVAEDIRSHGGREPLLVRADVLDPKAIIDMVEAVKERFGRIDILVNNAGGLLERHSVEEMPDEGYVRVMELNVGSTFRVSRSVIPIMKKSGGGAIINLTSIAARNGGSGGATLYATSKAAVSTLTRGMAKELAPFKIRVNAIAPGIVLTPFHDKYTSPDVLKQLIAGIPLGRAATAEEIAGPALFLASEQLASFITGEILEVNGGSLMA